MVLVVFIFWHPRPPRLPFLPSTATQRGKMPRKNKPKKGTGLGSGARHNAKVFKVTVVGRAEAGKSSLCMRFVANSRLRTYEHTTALQLHHREMDVRKLRPKLSGGKGMGAKKIGRSGGGRKKKRALVTYGLQIEDVPGEVSGAVEDNTIEKDTRCVTSVAPSMPCAPMWYDNEDLPYCNRRSALKFKLKERGIFAKCQDFLRSDGSLRFLPCPRCLQGFLGNPLALALFLATHSHSRLWIQKVLPSQAQAPGKSFPSTSTTHSLRTNIPRYSFHPVQWRLLVRLAHLLVKIEEHLTPVRCTVLVLLHVHPVIQLL